MSTKRGSWKTGYGFYLLAIGSACGLGNLWRFPYVVGENGGGAFILLYGLMAMAIGAPLLIGELLLGKETRRSVIVATRQMSQNTQKKWIRFVGPFAVLITLVVFSYYSVISGWVLHYVTQFFVALFSSTDQFGDKGDLNVLMSNGWLQVMLASAHILLSVVVVLKGVQQGLERWIAYSMPIFLVLVVILVVRSFSLSSTPEVLRFLFYPDFSKLTWSSLNHALGHVFFTLSVGFGTMVTFGSYMREKDHIPTAGFRVAIVDTFISIVAVIMIFPIAFQAANTALTDPGLMFEVLPRYLLEGPGKALFGLAFFLCLYLAALNASIGLLEVIVSNWVDLSKKVERTKATWLSALVALFIAIGPALSNSFLKNIRIAGKSILENVDSILINWFLPVIALGIIVSYNLGVSDKLKEISFVDKNKFVSYSMYPHWLFVIKWIGPAIIVTGLLLQTMGLFF